VPLDLPGQTVKRAGIQMGEANLQHHPLRRLIRRPKKVEPLTSPWRIM
jgi:hypothetical protein